MIPDFRSAFKSDLVKNFQRLTNNMTKQLFMPDIEKEGIMYACSMAIEFKEKAGFLSGPMVDDITNQVCDVLSQLFKEYDESHRAIALIHVRDNMSLGNIKDIVNQYYLSY